MGIIKWSEIVDGVLIYKGGHVVHNRIVWKCEYNHAKGAEHEPGASDAWERGLITQ